MVSALLARAMMVHFMALAVVVEEEAQEPQGQLAL
jgi:hypothetical protein